MSGAVEFRVGSASEAEIGQHLRACEKDFQPPLASRVRIDEYAGKIAARATCFEAWEGGRLVGMVAAYFNDPQGEGAYVTSVSVLRSHAGRGIARDLMERCVRHARALKCRRIRLEVGTDNEAALRLYGRQGFLPEGVAAPLVMMGLRLDGGDEDG